MPRFSHPPIRLVALVAAVAGAALVAAPGAARAAAYAPGRVIVGVRATRPAAELVPWRFGDGDGVEREPTRPAVRDRLLRLPRGETVRAALRRLRGRPRVAWAEPDYLAHAAGFAPGGGIAHAAAGPFVPDDPGRANRPQGWEAMQWNLLPGMGIDAPQAWANLLADRRAGGAGVRIAVLDTGVAYRNWRGFHESPDLRGARFVDPYDYVAGNRYPLDRDGHGTFVASAIAESTNNDLGLTGVAYGAQIMPIRVLSADGIGDESAIADGIRDAVAHHAQIINLSLEFVPDQVHSARAIPEIVSAIADARRHGVMVIAAAGNDQLRELAYPARLPGVVAVGATTRDGCLASYSNVGPGLALVAPGGGSDALIPSDPVCHPGRDLPPVYQLTLSDPPHWGRFGYPRFYVGTSMSVPQVAGAAALVIASGVLGRHPTPAQVLRRLELTATPLPAGARRPNARYGWGLIDAAAATSPLAVTARR